MLRQDPKALLVRCSSACIKKKSLYVACTWYSLSSLPLPHKDTLNSQSVNMGSVLLFVADNLLLDGSGCRKENSSADSGSCLCLLAGTTKRRAEVAVMGTRQLVCCSTAMGMP